METTYNIYKNNLILSFAIEITYVSLYISAYHDKRWCYKLQISCLAKQGKSTFRSSKVVRSSNLVPQIQEIVN